MKTIDKQTLFSYNPFAFRLGLRKNGHSLEVSYFRVYLPNLVKIIFSFSTRYEYDISNH